MLYQFSSEKGSVTTKTGLSLKASKSCLRAFAYATISKAVTICCVSEQSTVRFADAQLMNVGVGGAAFRWDERSKIRDLNNRRVQHNPATSGDQLQMLGRIIDQV